MDELRYQNDLLKAMNQRLMKQEKMYRMVVEASDGTNLYYNEDTGEFAVFGDWNHFFTFDMKEPQDFLKIYDQVSPEFEDKLKCSLFPERYGKSDESVECLSADKKRWYQFITHVNYKNTPDSPGKCNISDKIVLVRDITKFKLQNDELAYFAYYDSLTGLFNRNYFVKRLGEMLVKAKKENEVVSVMMLDIDDFHKINDGIGMVEGDELVQQFGAFLKDQSNDRVISCRFNNDVFCIAIYSPDIKLNADTVYRLVKHRNSKPYIVGMNQEVYMSVSVGVADYPEAAQNSMELINCAEIVMLRCKNMGKDSIKYFDAPILDDFLDSIEIEHKLKDAIFSNSFELFYQPQYYSGTKQLRGMETLIRWRDGMGSFISPVVFIPIAEKNGSIIPIGNWVIEESIRQFSVWKKDYKERLTLSINVSARQYLQEHFVDRFLDTIEKYQVDPSEIEIEVTESILIDDFEGVTEKLRSLKSHGVRVSLDDFGTGFSSLSYLKKLPIDTLKIDKSFIDTVLTDKPTKIITESIINMAKELGFESVAEGVEYETQYDYLKQIGCDIIQGYYFSKPLPADEFEQLLEKQE